MNSAVVINPAEDQGCHALYSDYRRAVSVTFGPLSMRPGKELSVDGQPGIEVWRSSSYSPGRDEWAVWCGLGTFERNFDAQIAAKHLLVLTADDTDSLLRGPRQRRRDLAAELPLLRHVLVVGCTAAEEFAHHFPVAAVAVGWYAPAEHASDSASALARKIEAIVEEEQCERRVVAYLPCGTTWAAGDVLRQRSSVHVLLDGVSTLEGTAAADYRSVHTHTLAIGLQHIQGVRVGARNAAWHVSVAAQRLGARVIVVDDPEVAVALLGHSALEAQVWLVHRGGRVVDGAPGGRDVRRVLDRGGRLVCTAETARQELEAAANLPPRAIATGYRGTGTEGSLDLGAVARSVEQYLPEPPVAGERVLVIAGHDFKFLGELEGVLDAQPRVSRIHDKWERQTQQDFSRSEQSLAEADVILCEFASHNAVWYSWHKRPGQRLVVRFHGYELFQDWMPDINIVNVDLFVFVSEFYRDRVVRELGWPPEKTSVIPNMVDLVDLDRPKASDARFHLGIVGIVPVLKRPDRALDFLELLLAEDDRYVLHIRGRHPWEYGWMWRDPVARDAYEAFYERLSARPELLRHVAFDGFGPDMGRWFRRVGWILSPSYRETFHLAPVEGMSGGAIPVVWERDGAVEIFGERWVHASTEEAAASVHSTNVDAESFDRESEVARQFVERYGTGAVAGRWLEALFPTLPSASSGLDDRFTLEAMEERFRDEPSGAVLDRLLVTLLHHGADARALEVYDAHPSLHDRVSQDVRSRVEETAVDRAFVTGSFPRPPRCRGTAYVAARGVVLELGHELRNPQKQPFVEPPPVDEDDTSPRLVLLSRRAPGGTEEPVGEFAEDTNPCVLVELAADSLVRACRVTRPEILVVGCAWQTSWPGVIAARRLGIPVVLRHDDGHAVNACSPWSAPPEEFDGMVSGAATVGAGDIRRIRQDHDRRTVGVVGHELGSLRVGLIADEFTRRTVGACCTTVPIHRSTGYLQVASEDLDVLLVESAWEGQEGEWFHGVAYYQNDRDDIERIIDVARARDIPVVFWNKEDPVHFRSFAPTAGLCDAVLTSDADCLSEYASLRSGGRPGTMASMPFYAEPTIHNPLPGRWEPRQTVSYAGTYYGQRYPDRSVELDGLLGTAEAHGLTVYDRQLTRPESQYRFPARYSPFIEGGLAYEEVLEAYKAHPVHLNVNTVTDSPTMFSRRAVEIAASGTVVLSGASRGLSLCLPQITATDDPAVWREKLHSWTGSTDAWAADAWRGLRAVRRAYLAEHALTIMFRTAGLPVALAPAVGYSAHVEDLQGDVLESILGQTILPAAVVCRRGTDGPGADQLREFGVQVLPAGSEPPTAWSSRWTGTVPEQYAEDVLYAARFLPDDVARMGAAYGPHDRALISWEREPELPVFTRDVPVCVRTRTLTWMYPGHEGEEQQ